MADLEELQESLTLGCRILVNQGLVRAVGHLSARIAGTETILISPRMSLALATKDNLAVIDLEGNQIAGEFPAPLERYIHTRIYRRRPDVMAIARTHSPYARVLSLVGQPLRLIDQSSAVLAQEVPIYPKPFLIATPELGDEVAATLGRGTAVLLWANGTAVTGRSVREACVRAVALEESAFYQYHALAIGQPQEFTPEERAAVCAVMLSDIELRRAWDYYVSRLP